MMNTVNQNPPGMLYQGDQIERKTIYDYLCWVFQIGVWLSFVLVIILAIAGAEAKNSVAFIFGFFYLVYICLEFFSPTSKYLCNKRTSEGIYEKMGIYFRTPPEINFFCECYHYEIRHHRGKGKSRTTKEKIVTYSENYSLPYYSERDVSGLFYLNCDKAYVERKHFIKLNLKEEINFADAISYMDYEFAKELFWRRNRFKDVYFNFVENRIVPGMTHYNLIQMSDQAPWSANFLVFCIATILTFSEIYKLYFNSFCVYQKFKVRKLVSTRYDLNMPVYQTFVPQINLIVQQYNYQPQDYNYVNNQYQVQLPTQEELERAKQYQNKIPNYQLSSGQGNIQAGVILDNPGYSSYEVNNNLPPAAFASYAGDVALNSNQINANGNLPPGFGKPQPQLPQLNFNAGVNIHPLNEDLDPDQSQRTALKPYPPARQPFYPK